MSPVVTVCVLVLKTSSPLWVLLAVPLIGGLKVEEFVSEIRGINTPLSGLLISKAAALLGVFVPIPYCDQVIPLIKVKMTIK